MLEDKIRAYVKSIDEVLYSDRIHSISIYDNELIWIENDYANMEQTLEEESLENVILLQGTNHNDEDNNEVFVGDILEIQADFVDTPQGSGYTQKKIDVVKDLEYFYTTILRNADTFKILGNIYENKDLLDKCE